MGGHDHHAEDLMKVPDYRVYKVEDAPEFVKMQNDLAKKGLKDPWVRNEVWRYNHKVWGTPASKLYTVFFRGFKYGFAAFVATIALESAVDAFKKKKGGSDHH